MAYTILCIDDHEQGLFVRKIVLERRGYKVLTATSGPRGLSLLQQQSIDAVILDYQMDGMDGAAVATMIRRKFPRMPILLLSGYTAELPKRLTQVVNGVFAKGQTVPSFEGILEDLLERT
jgi:CheY-like chemotaxis protein